MAPNLTVEILDQMLKCFYTILFESLNKSTEIAKTKFYFCPFHAMLYMYTQLELFPLSTVTLANASTAYMKRVHSASNAVDECVHTCVNHYKSTGEYWYPPSVLPMPSL